MRNTKTIIALGLITIGQFYYNIFEKKIQENDNVGTIKLLYADCEKGFLNAEKTIVMGIAHHMEVVHSVDEAKTFLKRLKDKSSVIVMIPTLTRMKMDENFCDQSQAEKDRTLLAAVQAELPD